MGVLSKTAGLALFSVAACAPVDSAPLGEPWTATQMPARRLETAAGALGTRLVIAGGFSASMTEGLPITMDVLTFDTLLGEWGSLPAAPVAWTHANVAAVGGAVYLLGGLDGRSFIAQPEAFVLEADALEWTPLDPLPEEIGRAHV